MNTSIQQSKLKSNSSGTSPSKDLDWAIGWNRFVLQILGLWTYSKQSLFIGMLSHFHTALIALSILIFVILPQSVALIKVWGRATLIIDNIALNLPVMAAEFKLLVLWYKKKDVASIFVTISQNWLEEKSSHERDVMIKYAKVSRILMICGSIGSIECVTLYHAPVAFNTVMRTINNITDIPGALFAIQSVYFYDVTPPFIYHLTVLSQIIGTAFASLLYTGVDVLFGMIIAHLCGQLENLSYKLENMANDQKSFQNILKIAQQKHCSLIRYRNQTEDIFSVLSLALVVLFSLIFCLESFHLISILSNNTVIPVTQVTFYVLFASYFLFLMFIYSWIGESLVGQCELLYNSVYNCNWTCLRSDEFSQIGFLLIHAQRPLYITFGKFAPVTLNTFAKVLKTSCGWVSVLLAMKN